MFRFSFLLAGVALVFGATFALDLSQQRIEKAGTSPIVFVSMWAIGEPMQQAYEAVFKRFEAEYPKFRVEARWEGRLALPAIRPRLLTNSDVPDILNTDLESLQVLVEEGYADPVDSLLATAPHPDDKNKRLTEALDPRLLSRCQQRRQARSKQQRDHAKTRAATSQHGAGRRTYLVPAGVWLHLVFYNRLHYRRLALKVPRTWSEFVENCRRLKASGITPIASDGYSYATQWPEIMLARALGEEHLRTTILSSNPDFTKDSRFRAVFQAIRDLHQPGWYLKGWQGSRWPIAQRRWIQGEATHMINGSWILRETNAYIPDPNVVQVGAFPVPLLDTIANQTSFSAYAEIPGYSLIKGGRNRQGATTLLRFLLRRSSGSTLAKVGKEIPSIVGAAFPEGLSELKDHLTNSAALLTVGMRGYAARWYKLVFHETYYPFFLHETPSGTEYLTVDMFLRKLTEETSTQRRHEQSGRRP